MTRVVIDRVEELARKEGFKSLKFLNRKREEVFLENADLLPGVAGVVNVMEDENFSGNLPT